MKGDLISAAGEAASASLQAQANLRERILVVEDNRDIRCLSAEMLSRRGYMVDTAADGAAAWEALMAGDYDLMITDNNMPNVSGVELLKKLHTARISLPVIMATGLLPKEEFTRYPWLQPTAMLQKPYSSDELLGTVREVLRVTDTAGGQVESLPDWRSQSSADGFWL